MGVLKWVDYTVSEASYFKLNTDHTPLHLVMVDEVHAACFPPVPHVYRFFLGVLILNTLISF